MASVEVFSLICSCGMISEKSLYMALENGLGYCCMALENGLGYCTGLLPMSFNQSCSAVRILLADVGGEVWLGTKVLITICFGLLHLPC